MALDGENLVATRQLLRRGIFWLVFSIFFDFFTSWLMMTELGPVSEGNLPTRSLFEIQNFGNMVNLLVNQWPWIFYVCLGLATYGIVKVQRRQRNEWLAIFFPLGICFTWLMATFRLILGPSSNLSSLLLSHGETFGIFGYYAIALVCATAIGIDFYGIIMKLNRE